MVQRLKERPTIKKSNDKETAALLADMNAGAVKSLIIIDTNPAYSIKGFAEAMKKVENTISLSDRHNETADACVYVVPKHNALESWNDAEPKSGVYAICQPAISPLFNTRQYQETLLSWAGNNTSFYEYIKNTAKGKTELAAGYSSFDAFWDNAVQNSETAVGEGSSLSFNGSNIANAVAAVATYKKSELEVKFYLSVHGDGSYADNPYIQELPDPMSRITWDNYIVANPTWAAKNGLTPDLNTKEYKTITLTMNGASVTLPVYPLPGVANGTLGIKVGFGRKTVNAEFSRGANVFPFMTTVNGNISSNAVASFKVTGEVAKLAAMQTYFTLDHQGLGGVKTRYVIKETSLNAYRKDPEAGNQIGGTPRKAWLEHHLVTLYGKHEMPGHQWGMVVDLNSCVGCGACVVACNIENNVPVVGQDQVHRSREMHWMRIDRYYTGDVENPEVTFQPMMCQHCDNAPCENVCPVSATNHSSEGLNQMAYNRCIGTRYCANNCPYKVRRFNWYDYTGSDSFNEQSFGVDNYDDKLGRFDSLARMVLNPDVTTRSRGVIEKCSFCVQRIQGAKLDAKKENRTLRDGDVKSACQTACPTNAITFGDVNNKDTQVHKLTMDERAFGVLEEIHTLPSVSYLTRVRNEDAIT
ncbi:MAG: 4Fe-4S dicluster domain-containing protein [Bacteroidetes bacterium]|nr:4Fe-4S dicluster domain-containing protein [Bacteroidota bacterium]